MDLLLSFLMVMMEMDQSILPVGLRDFYYSVTKMSLSLEMAKTMTIEISC